MGLLQGSPLVRRTNGDERRRIGDERGAFSGFLGVLIGSDEWRRTATNGDERELWGVFLRIWFGLLRNFGPEYFPTFISD